MSDVSGSAGAAAARGQVPYVLDASALLCLINGEAGSERVGAVLPSAVISAVNLAEVAAKLGELGADAEASRTLLAPLHLTVVPFDEATAYATGALRSATRGQGLSLGDRACQALSVVRAGVGERVGVPVEMLR